MATLQEIIAKRQELWPNATNVDARKALTAQPIANAPVAWVAPAITPIAPATPPAPVTPTPAPPTAGSFNEQTQWMNADQRRAVRAWVVPPSKEGTATPSGATLTPEGQIVQPWATPITKTPTENITQTDFQKAQAESEKIKAQNEAQMALNKQKAELRQAERDKETGVQTAEALKVKQEAEAQLANNEWAILGTLRAGWIIPEAVKSSPYYKSAENTYKQIQNFRTMGQGQLATAISNGALMPWTNTYNELIKDPAMEARIKEARIYATPVNPNKFLENQSSQILSQNSKVAQAFDDWLLSLDEYNQMTNNPDVVSQAKLKQEKEQALNTFNKEWSDARDKAKKEFAWSAFLDSILSDIDKWYKSRADYLQWEVQIATWTLSDLKATSTALFNANINEYIAYRNGQIEVDKTKATNAMDLQQNQAEYDQKIAQQAQAMWTPELAIPSVIEQYASQGVFAQKSAQQHIADAKALIAKGGTLGEYISQMQKDFQAKPEYKAKFAPKATENFELKEVGGKTYRFNQATGQYDVISPITAWSGGDLRYLADQFPNQAWAKNNNPAGITWNANFDKWTGTAKLLTEAGIQFSKGTARPANEWGNYVTFPTIEDGLKAQQIIMSQTYGNSTVGQMLASWVWTGEWVNYAKQVAGMAWVDPNVKVSSLTPEQLSTLQMAKIKKESPGLYGLLSQGTGTQGTTRQYTDQNINDLAYLTELQEKNPTQAAKDMKELGYNARDLANYKAGNVPLTEKQKNSSTEVMNAIRDLVDPSKYEWNDAVGKFDPKRIIGTQDAEDATVAINNLIAKMTLPNLWVLKWPMSDRDIDFIKQASSKLATTQSNDSFERNLIDAYNLSARRAGMAEIKNLSDITTDTQKETVGGELDYSKYE